MTREELLKNAKPVLFNTEMVKAILECRKTVTRRCVKYKYSNTEMKMRTDKYGTNLIEIQKNVEGETYGKHPDGRSWQKLLAYQEKKPPYKQGDILYIRETWTVLETVDGCPFYAYKADDVKVGISLHETFEKWKPSIHMPKEAARIFLKVKDVRVERLQEITEEQAHREGTNPWDEACYADNGWHPTLTDLDSGGDCDIIAGFHKLWNSTIKKSELATYGWDANPYVWVIEFERIEV